MPASSRSRRNSSSHDHPQAAAAGQAAAQAAADSLTPSPSKRHRDENQPDTSPLPRKDPPIYRIAVTGGPCAGKSTFLAVIKNTLEERTGVRVFCVPEAATMLVTGGLQWNDDNEKTIENQLALLRTQIALEDAFYQIAKATRAPSVIICDRGVMDGRAYCTAEQYDEILRRGGYILERLRDTRYDAVIHLVTAAIGAKQHYNLDNPARFEDIDGAIKADHHLRNMYVGHPRVKLIDNSGGNFQKKLDRAIDVVYEIIGQRKPKHRSRRYLVKDAPDLDKLPVPAAASEITISVLSGSEPGNVRLLLKRAHGAANATFLFFNPSIGEDGEKTEVRHMLTPREYATLSGQKDPAHDDLVKRGVSFTFEGLFFELATFTEPPRLAGRRMLYVMCDEDAEPQLPPWVTVERDTTNDDSFSSFHLSKHT